MAAGGGRRGCSDAGPGPGAYEVIVETAVGGPGLAGAARAAEAAARVALGREGAPAGAELGVLLTGDGEMQGYNRRYRGLDRPTDVLSFPMDPAVPDGEPVPLGDVIVSIDAARRQAAEAGHPLETEVAMLVAHGVLHILGYDHDGEPGSGEMARREAEILDALDGPRDGG